MNFFLVHLIYKIKQEVSLTKDNRIFNQVLDSIVPPSYAPERKNRKKWINFVGIDLPTTCSIEHKEYIYRRGLRAK